MSCGCLNGVAKPLAHVGDFFGKSQKTKLHPFFGNIHKEDTCLEGLLRRVRRYILLETSIRRATLHSLPVKPRGATL